MALSSSPAKELCAQTPDEICLDCSKYDFQAALSAINSDKHPNRSSYPSDGIVIAKIGKRYRTPFETNCSLCRILLASRKSALSLYPISNQSKYNPDELRALLASQSSALKSYLIHNHNSYNAYELQALFASQDSILDEYSTNNQNNGKPDDIEPRALLASR